MHASEDLPHNILVYYCKATFFSQVLYMWIMWDHIWLYKIVSHYISITTLHRPCYFKPRCHVYVQACAIHTSHFDQHYSTPQIVELVMALLLILWHSKCSRPTRGVSKMAEKAEQKVQLKNMLPSMETQLQWRRQTSKVDGLEKAPFVCSISVTSRCWRRQNIVEPLCLRWNILHWGNEGVY